jgi:hypothetical protein
VGHATIGTQSERRRWMALALVVTAQFMVILDATIVNVALPSIQRDLGFAQENLQWVITAYTIMFGGTLLLGGRLADWLGRRRLLLVGARALLSARCSATVGGPLSGAGSPNTAPRRRLASGGILRRRRPARAGRRAVIARAGITNTSPLRHSGCCLHVDDFCVVARRVRGRCRRGRRRLEIVTA